MDNLSYFEKNVIIEKMNPNQTIALACLCGAEKVATFLMSKIEETYLTPEYNYILGYVCASQNFEWAKSIAQTLAQAGKEIPPFVSLYSSNFSAALEIKDIFKKKNELEGEPGVTTQLSSNTNQSTPDDKHVEAEPMN